MKLKISIICFFLILTKAIDHFEIVESIPLNVDLKTTKSTYEAFRELIQNAKHNLFLAEFYIHLTDGKNHLDAGGQMGVDIFNDLIDAHKRGVKIVMVMQKPTKEMPDEDAFYFIEHGIADVKFINWDEIIGSGILHTKMIIADYSNFYIGSANLDWASLAQVKELGIYVTNNHNLTNDAWKIFSTYYLTAVNQKIPNPWPLNVYASYNNSSPQYITSSDYVYLSVCPPQYLVPDREDDLKSLLNTINLANKSISIEVMDYFPGTNYLKQNYYWGGIDDALRSAAFRGVKIRFLVSNWTYSNKNMFQYLKSLNAIHNIEVKLFEISNWVPFIPFTRVNHAKFMVTEDRAFVSTSNWSADYFFWTGGVSLNWVGDKLVKEIQSTFDRDWNSPYTNTLKELQIL